MTHIAREKVGKRKRVERERGRDRERKLSEAKLIDFIVNKNNTIAILLPTIYGWMDGWMD